MEKNQENESVKSEVVKKQKKNGIKIAVISLAGMIGIIAVFLILF